MAAHLLTAPDPASKCVMKSLRLFGIISLALLATVRADLTIIEKVDSNEGTHRLTLKMKGDKTRVEVNPQITTIMDGKTGDLTTLLNDKKTAMRIPGDKAKAMAEMAKSIIRGQSTEIAAPQPTGRKETIAGYETEEYATGTAKYHASYWIAKSYPDYQSILQQMTAVKNGAFSDVIKGLPDYRNLPGLPLRTRVKVEGQFEITSTVESISRDPIADPEFSIPAGFTEMKLPDLFGGKQSPAKPDQTGNE